MRDVVMHSARVFGRAIIMPNLKPPVRTVADALAYRERILAALPSGYGFQPLMTLYLTPETTPADIQAAAECPHVYAVKLYPAGATTNADAGVRDLEERSEIFAAMVAFGLPLLIHGESIKADVDVFDRESTFLHETLAPLCDRFPELRIVVEHITTADAVTFVRQAGAHVAATITAHHLLHNRNAIFQGGIRPDYYCLPILKRAEHQAALIEAATSGHPRFFLGTDSAPHARSAKLSACGCAGIFTAYNAMALYAEVFDRAQALERLEGFASHFGPDFYGLPRNSDRITLERIETPVPLQLPFADGELLPLRAGETVDWRVSDASPA